ncbi:alanine racemase [Pseudalkalibacillus hwajinpoensis]|uniref:Alanine racemase n=1 Tax=Guptibacillus hwajinpoensis TaxID=208199 RepID=A0A4U1MAF2_9BACL|nr:alanine racemase [Pseudalkalibacillus hwajinpoensis]TKD67461.1 alanine racemase [Pseudalkalibacillus hwajinpoensis]
MENQPFYRETWAEINLDAIKQNIVAYKNYVPSDVSIMAVVKANGYGHGAVATAETALQSGATYLAVAILDEALMLRKEGVTAPILVLGWVPPVHARLAAEQDITLTVFQLEWIEQAEANLNGLSLTIHLKIDTGMGRLGIKEEKEAKLIVECLRKKPSFRVEGLYTHFATADEPDNPFIETQRNRFEKMASYLKAEGIHPTLIHLGNSAGAVRIPERIGNMIRVGISMYGLSPSQEMKSVQPFNLNPAFSLHSQLVNVKQMKEGEPISYGSTYHTTEGEWIGTVPIGYADGWIRKLRDGYVLVNGEQAPIVGRICMDQFMVRLPAATAIGTHVTLIGQQGTEEITIDDIAERLETINYEIPCMIGPRVPRIFRENGEKKGVMNTILKK